MVLRDAEAALRINPRDDELEGKMAEFKDRVAALKRRAPCSAATIRWSTCLGGRPMDEPANPEDTAMPYQPREVA